MFYVVVTASNRPGRLLRPMIGINCLEQTLTLRRLKLFSSKCWSAAAAHFLPVGSASRGLTLTRINQF